MNRRTSERRIGATLLIVMLGLMSLGYAGTGQTLSGHVAWRETTLFSDNFDRHLLGSFPSAGGWETVWSGRDGGRENKTVYGPSVSQPQSFQLWGSPNWSAVVQRKFSTTASIIGYEFAIQIEKIGTGGPGREESPGFFCKEAATWGGYYARVFFSHDTKRIEGEGGVVLGTWEPGRWYRVKVILVRTPIAPGIPGLDSNVYSVWIDGKLAGQNIKTAGDTYQINALALFSGHPGVKVWYDDVRVFTVDQVSVLTSPEWHIDFQGDYFHAGTYGQTGPVAHSPAGIHWNVFEVPALKQPWPTPYATYPSLLLREKGGLMTGVSLCIEGDAYGWAGGAGADPLVGDYLIFLTHNAFGVSNNPTWWKIRGLAPDTRYCLTFYHALTGAHDRGLVFGVLHAFHTSLVEVSGVPGRNVASECVTSSGEGTITAWVKVDDRLGVEGDWAGLTIRLEPAVARPDLVVDSITPTPANPVIGQTITFQVTVRNQGQASAGSFVVRLQGAGPSQDRTVSSLAAGASTSLTFTLPLSSSPETFTATADVNNQVAETNEDNNTRQVGMAPPPPQADLVVQEITYTPTSPTVGSTVTFTVTVRNQGAGPAGSFVVRLQGTGPSQDRTVSSLAAGALTTVTFSLPLSTSGETFTATADVNNQVAESNEGNNTRQVRIAPPPPQADLVVQEITYTPPEPTVGSTVTFTVTVRNQGAGPTGPFVVRLQGAGPSQDRTVGSLEAGASTNIMFTLPLSASPETFTATVDVHNHVSESNEDNNTRQVRLPKVETGDYGDAPDPTFPSRGSSKGPCHLDVSKEWIGPAGKSTTTTEPDARGTNLDQDDGDPLFWRAGGATWFGVRVSYDPTKSSAADSRYLNLLVDINGDRKWDGGDEWAVQNFQIPFDALPAGVSTMLVVTRVPDSVDPMALAGRWVRITLSTRKVPDGTGAWGVFDRGETEDHLAKGGLVDPGEKVRQITSTRILEWFRNPGYEDRDCPHGKTGIEIPLGWGSPVHWVLSVPPGTVQVKLALVRVPECACSDPNDPRCSKLVPPPPPPEPQFNVLRLRTGDKPQMADPFITPLQDPPGAATVVFGRGIAPWIPLWMFAPPPTWPPRKFILDGWFQFPGAPPGHDAVRVTVTIVVDPEDEWICTLYWVEPVMMIYRGIG